MSQPSNGRWALSKIPWIGIKKFVFLWKDNLTNKPNLHTKWRQWCSCKGKRRKTYPEFHNNCSIFLTVVSWLGFETFSSFSASILNLIHSRYNKVNNRNHTFTDTISRSQYPWTGHTVWRHVTHRLLVIHPLLLYGQELQAVLKSVGYDFWRIKKYSHVNAGRKSNSNLFTGPLDSYLFEYR